MNAASWPRGWKSLTPTCNNTHRSQPALSGLRSVHRREPYRTLYPEQTPRLAKTDSLWRGVLVLPTGTAISVEDVKRVCEVIRKVGGSEVGGTAVVQSAK
jgi:dTDP-4-amino-4,6-dideoxygalactose transaminase